MPFAFFGLCLEPEKTYSQTVSKSFRISMASFGENILSNGERSCVKVEVDGEEFVLCSLNPGSNEQQTLDVVFETDEEITLSATGKNSVHLTGNYLPEEDYEHDHDHDDMEYDSAEYESADSNEMEEGDEDYSDEEEVTKEDLDRLRALIASHAEDDDEDSEEDPDFSESQEDEDDEEDLEEGDEEEDLDEEMSDAEPIEVGQKRKAEKASPIADKKMKDNTAAAVKTVQPTKVEKAPKAEKKLENSAATPTSDAQAPSDKPLSKKQKKAAAAKARAEQEAEKAKAKPEEKAAEVQKTKAKPEEKATESPMKKVLGNGLQIEDVKVGTGVRAKKGKKVGVRYIGKLVSNGKVFDKNVAGKPFTFNLGRGEVIKGWDMGVDGMSVGGERRLVIPAVLAYGARGAPPDIPKNATLEFEVKLLSVN